MCPSPAARPRTSCRRTRRAMRRSWRGRWARSRPAPRSDATAPHALHRVARPAGEPGRRRTDIAGHDGHAADRRLLDRFTRRRCREAVSGFVVPARLQPAADHRVVDEQHLPPIRRNHERAGGNVPRHRLAPIERVPLCHLPAQQRQMLARPGDLREVSGDDGLERSCERSVRDHLPMVDGQVPCCSPRRSISSKPWAPKKSRCPCVRFAVPSA